MCIKFSLIRRPQMFFALNKMDSLNSIAVPNLHLFTVSNVSEIFDFLPRVFLYLCVDHIVGAVCN